MSDKKPAVKKQTIKIGTILNLDPNESDPTVLWAAILIMHDELKGPEGFESWKDAAVAERMLRVKAENKLKGADGQVWHAVLNRAKNEGVIFLDKADADWTAKGGDIASAPALGASFQDIYEENVQATFIKV